MRCVQPEMLDSGIEKDVEEEICNSIPSYKSFCAMVD